MKRKQIEAILSNNPSKSTIYDLANEILGPRGQRNKYWRHSKKKQLKEIHKKEHEARLQKKRVA